jgi:predicted O-linked N-acetylglucosamine transferase (SPINDLY family)
MPSSPQHITDGAIAILRHALEQRPEDAELRCELAGLLHRAGEVDEAVDLYRAAVAADPALRRGWYNLGCLANEQGREADALDYFRRSIELDPAHAPSWHNLGQALFNLGDTDAAIEHYRQATALGAGAFSETMLAMTIGVSPSANPQTVLQTRRRWAGRNLPPPIAKTRQRTSSRSPIEERRLRVGYVSAYFEYPNWMKPVWTLANRHDRDRFELFFYSDGQPQRIPQGYRPLASDHWHWTGSLGAAEMAQLIAEHDLDLLVDLNGFSRLPRLAVFALRPTQRQIGWFNMFATTGIAGFDYLIGDETVVHTSEEVDYSERIVRIAGCYLTFEVTYPAPDVSPLPGQSIGRFTFGSLASLYKITPQVIASWAEILRRCPDSRLLLRNSGLRTMANQDWLRERFLQHGIAPDRLQLAGPTDHYEFLRTYDEIDLALDTFPYNGGTTTSEALWQGVPVVASHGDRWTSRVSASLLANAGLGEFIARDAASYLNLATSFAHDPAARDHLAALRISLREQLLRSSVCNADGFARRMEAAYSAIIQEEDAQ